ncbi:MAG: hypothetical protein ACFFAX_12855 [Promethearchaeota archaeon]
MSSSLPATRVDFPQAIVEVLAALKEVPSASISGLARSTGIDRRTVSKAIDLIMSVQDSLATRKIDRRKEGKMWVVTMRNRTVEFFQSAIRRLRSRGEKG